MAEPELFQLVRFFDSDEDGRLSYQDFMQMLLPCEDNLLRAMTIERPSYRVGRYDFMPRDIEQLLAAVIEREIELQRLLDLLKRELEAQHDFSPMAAFRSIDRYCVGRIDTVSLGTFLRANGHNASEIEVLAIIRRIDTDGDACLDVNEFSEFLKS